MRKTEITIKRPNGDIETIDITKKFPGGISKPMFEQIKAANKKAGKGECLSYEITTIDNRTQAEKDYALIVSTALNELHEAQESSYHDPARIIKARSSLDKANEIWAEKHPEAAAKAMADSEKEAANKKAEIKNSPGYKAAIEGRD